ncbi:hypothetical protein DFH06DRAFT_1186395 [Mycena polygramma]|nr:hypothetical protein DFH06DRAFT_1259221 [Mycena polygramma]KAJ7665016.1 hypothetical protein DFH06DRAFT_1186395 [Mycena polygramma]
MRCSCSLLAQSLLTGSLCKASRAGSGCWLCCLPSRSSRCPGGGLAFTPPALPKRAPLSSGQLGVGRCCKSELRNSSLRTRRWRRCPIFFLLAPCRNAAVTSTRCLLQ